ncbi:MAG: prepilin-type N-terminal cleavage/methylation domain-containing protein [Phycisphaerales bacterium]|nr:prepilin-type N-terminal cleavage/methylation domain-containing protein [Phycisphaerales bacterium]
MTRRGMTMLELLAALALLSTFVVGAHAWMMSMIRAQRVLGDHGQVFIDRTLAALQQDLDGAVEIQVDEGHQLTVRTAHALPGDPITDTGWQQVTWARDGRKLVRTCVSAPGRAILVDVSMFEVLDLEEAPSKPRSLQVRVSLLKHDLAGELHWSALE